jgi:hypothetical protein
MVIRTARPYAAKAIIEHEFDTDHLNIFVAFRFPMDETVKPPLNLWICEVDDIVKAVTVSAWIDAYTLLLTVPDVVVLPDRVTLEYNGPNVLFLDCSVNDVVIGAFVGGVNGQVLHIARLCASANDATLEHNEGTENQNIFLHKGLDETLTGEYGGWNLVCDGANWYDVSHAKHA